MGRVGTLAPDSLLWRINSLLVANSFPVVVELIPCSVAQGIFGEATGKILDSRLFSRRFFAENGGIGGNSLLFPCNRGFGLLRRPGLGRLRSMRLVPIPRRARVDP
jgi:hypothetical protein